jgi:hypothetical protein
LEQERLVVAGLIRVAGLGRLEPTICLHARHGDSVGVTPALRITASGRRRLVLAGFADPRWPVRTGPARTGVSARADRRRSAGAGL